LLSLGLLVSLGMVPLAATWITAVAATVVGAGSAFDQMRTLTALVGPPLLLLLLVAWGCVAGWQRLARSQPLSLRRGGQVLDGTRSFVARRRSG